MNRRVSKKIVRGVTRRVYSTGQIVRAVRRRGWNREMAVLLCALSITHRDVQQWKSDAPKWR